MDQSVAQRIAPVNKCAAGTVVLLIRIDFGVIINQPSHVAWNQGVTVLHNDALVDVGHQECGLFNERPSSYRSRAFLLAPCIDYRDSID